MKESWDYEQLGKEKTIDFWVYATGPHLNDFERQRIIVRLKDVNDNPPFFDQSLYEADVNEDEDIQHTVITVTAKDKDESTKMSYEIVRGNYGGAFAVMEDTGVIYVAAPLDYETRKEFGLRFVASDNLNENYTTIVIHIKDVNDNPPDFDSTVASILGSIVGIDILLLWFGGIAYI